MEADTDWSVALVDLQKAWAERRGAELNVIAAAREVARRGNFITKHFGYPYEEYKVDTASVRDLSSALAKLDALNLPPRSEDDTRPLTVEPSSYKRARGILAPADEPAEESIRRIRGGSDE